MIILKIRINNKKTGFSVEPKNFLKKEMKKTKVDYNFIEKLSL